MFGENRIETAVSSVRLVKRLEELNDGFMKFQSAHQSCRETYAAIKWTNETFCNACQFMQPVLTELGACYSFNMIPMKVLLRDFYYEVLVNFLKHGYTLYNVRARKIELIFKKNFNFLQKYQRASSYEYNTLPQ